MLKELVKLADDLDRKGATDMAGLVDNLIKRYAEDMSEESADEGSEEADSGEAEAPMAATDESSDLDAEYAETGGSEDLDGMMGPSWYGQGPSPKWDLAPVGEGEFAGGMLDKRMPLPTDVGAAPAHEVVETEEVVSEEEPSEADGADEDKDEEEMVQEASVRLAELANGLDKKGYFKEASMVDAILADLKK